MLTLNDGVLNTRDSVWDTKANPVGFDLEARSLSLMMIDHRDTAHKPSEVISKLSR
jgi:hypothetical protein